MLEVPLVPFLPAVSGLSSEFSSRDWRSPSPRTTIWNKWHTGTGNFWYVNFCQLEYIFFLYFLDASLWPFSRDGKMYKHENNVCVQFCLDLVKPLPSFTLFYCKSELFCNFALLGVTLMALNLVNFKLLLLKLIT